MTDEELAENSAKCAQWGGLDAGDARSDPRPRLEHESLPT
jgi:hypothetical protein